MGIIVNKVALNFNYKNFDTPYFSRVARSCPVSSTALADGSFIICKAGGLAWFVAPASTQLGSQWANGQYNGSVVGDKCCVSEWGTLSSLLTNHGYTPTEWFVPNRSQLENPGYLCRSNWGSSLASYWSSTENGCACASNVCFQTFCSGTTGISFKSGGFFVRAFRCVTY